MILKTLRVCAWNINGFNSRTIGIKLVDRGFLRVLRDIDIVCLTETHMHRGNLNYLNIPGFQILGYKNREKNKKSNTAPGGIAIFVRENVLRFCTIIKTDNENTIWTKLKKGLTGATKDIFLATSYLSPAQEKSNSNTKISQLCEEISRFQDKGHVIINGDLNAWTGNINDTIPPDKSDENFHIINNDIPPNRNSMHKNVNKRGLELLDMCKSLGLYILNGRKIGDPFGAFTSFQANGNSVVDYLITSDSLADEVVKLKIGDFVPWLSDHCPLLYELEITGNALEPNQKQLLKPVPKQYRWSEEGTTKFLKVLQNNENKAKLRDALSMDYTDPSKRATAVKSRTTYF